MSALRVNFRSPELQEKLEGLPGPVPLATTLIKRLLATGAACG